MDRGTPKVDKPLRKRKRSIRNEAEKRAVGVMPGMGDPPRGGVGGNRAKEGGKRDLVKILFCKRKKEGIGGTTNRKDGSLKWKGEGKGDDE